jgi:hypothetical protein
MAKETLQPKIVEINNGTGWGEAYTYWLANNNIRHITGPAYHPEAQSIVERASQTLGLTSCLLVRPEVRGRTRWPELVPPTLNLVNTTWNRITRISPRQVLRGENTKVAARIRRWQQWTFSMTTNRCSPATTFESR